MTSQTFDSILSTENIEPRKATTFPWNKVKPYVSIDTYAETIIAPVNDYRHHPRTQQFVLDMSTQTKEMTRVR